MKVLIVEDDPGTCQMLETVLATAGHSCRIVTSGSAAIMAALTEEHDLLICDMGLPDLPGSEIIRAIKAQSPRLPVVAIGDDSADVWEQQVLDAGGSCYLPRPVHEEDLRMEVNMVEKARLQLNIVLVDPDAIHRIWVGKTLESLGCQVQSFDTVVNAQIVL
ncbi:response regulator, partial [Myxococcota bacterium]|nr:response regulator [Myxococcota bacterium]